MSSDLERLVDAVVARVQQEIGPSAPKGSVVPKVAGGASSPTSVGGERGKPRPDLARIIDHTLLKPDATRDDLRKLCSEAMAWHFFSVCVNSVNVPFCRQQLQGSTVACARWWAFPSGR
jgi:hypothetical protein